MKPNVNIGVVSKIEIKIKILKLTFCFLKISNDILINRMANDTPKQNGILTINERVQNYRMYLIHLKKTIETIPVKFWN